MSAESSLGAESVAGPVPGRCARCRHWTPFDPEQRVNTFAVERNRLGLCGRVVNQSNLVDWDNYEPGEHAEVVAKTEACTTDLSGCSALRTAATFGCTLFEPSERAQAPERRWPVQGSTRPPGTVAESEAREAYAAYVKRGGAGQSFERLHERGGFGYGELELLLGRAPTTWQPCDAKT